jgi:hypothetical protein
MKDTEEGSNIGGRSTSNGTSTTNQEEGRSHNEEMKWRSLKWRKTWETKLWKEMPTKCRDLGLGGQ